MVGDSSQGITRPLQGLLERGVLGRAHGLRAAGTFARGDDAEAAFCVLVAAAWSGGRADVPGDPGQFPRCGRCVSGDVRGAARASLLDCAAAGSGQLVARSRPAGRGKARVADARRRLHEGRLAERTRTSDVRDCDWRSALHDELEGLPESLRAAVVLCYLEEMSYAAAAGRLGVTEGTIRGRLARARELLRTRLTRDGESAAAWTHRSVRCRSERAEQGGSTGLDRRDGASRNRGCDGGGFTRVAYPFTGGASSKEFLQ